MDALSPRVGNGRHTECACYFDMGLSMANARHFTEGVADARLENFDLYSQRAICQRAICQRDIWLSRV